MAHIKEANYLKTIPLLPFEREVVMACLIGDGSLMKSGKHYRLRFGHTIRHSDYVKWKYLLIKRLCVTEPQVVPKTKSMRAGTIGHPELTKMREQWYENGVKFIPANFRLTPLTIAIWFMDDGCRIRRSVNFSVHNFSEESIRTLQNELETFGILTTIQFDGKGSRLYVKQSSYESFKGLVKPYIQPCMAYKLP